MIEFRKAMEYIVTEAKRLHAAKVRIEGKPNAILRSIGEPRLIIKNLDGVNKPVDGHR